MLELPEAEANDLHERRQVRAPDLSEHERITTFGHRILSFCPVRLVRVGQRTMQRM